MSTIRKSVLSLAALVGAGHEGGGGERERETDGNAHQNHEQQEPVPDQGDGALRPELVSDRNHRQQQHGDQWRAPYRHGGGARQQRAGDHCRATDVPHHGLRRNERKGPSRDCQIGLAGADSELGNTCDQDEEGRYPRTVAPLGRARHRCDQATGHDRYGAGDQQRQASSPPV